MSRGPELIIDNTGNDNYQLKLGLGDNEFNQLVRLAKGIEGLTGQQRNVFNRVIEGKSTKMISREMGIAVGTVKVHLASVYNKVGVNSRQVMMALMLQHVDGLVKAGSYSVDQGYRSGEFSIAAQRPRPRFTVGPKMEDPWAPKKDN